MVQRVSPPNGSVSPSLLAKATSPLRPVASPPPTSPPTTTPLLRSTSGGSTNQGEMTNGSSAQSKASPNIRLRANEGKAISDSPALSFMDGVSGGPVSTPEAARRLNSGPPPCPPASPPTHTQEPAESEPKSAKLTMDQLQFEANQLKLALATR